MKKILCIDFDGVLHSYKSRWQGARVIADEPVNGAISWLYQLIFSNKFDICIYSSRSRQFGGKRAMKNWIIKSGLPKSLVDEIKFPTKKPTAYLTIDDRAIRFEGVFPTVNEIDSFRSWYEDRYPIEK